MKSKFSLILITLVLCYNPEVTANDNNNFFTDLKDKIAGWFSYESSEDRDSLNNNNAHLSSHTSDVVFSKKAIAPKVMNERRIYLIDLTRSMGGFNGSENIFETVKSQLTSAIANINDTTTEFVFIPFTDKPLEIFIEKTGQKQKILDYINNLTLKKGDTNILGAWNKGIEYLDDSKINYLFVLTDGVHNSGASIEELYRALSDWHHISTDKYEFAFYVLLTPKAKEKEICQIVESSKQMWLVPTLKINTDFIVGKMNLTVNIRNNTRVQLHLACTNPKIFNEGFKFKLSIPENKYYKLVEVSDIINKDGMVRFTIEKLKPQIDLPISYKTKIIIDYDKEKFPFIFFTPEEYNLNEVI